MKLRIATRQSALARYQAEWVKARLEALGHAAELVLIETQGDRENRPFAEMQGQGFFTKAVQAALLAGEAELAVHSHKDLPTAPVAMLEVAAIPERADARDALVIRPEAYTPDAPELPLTPGAKVGTSAARRQAQLRALRPDLVPRELRGNVPTRVDKLRQGHYDAIMLAMAGITRLGLKLDGLVLVPLAPERFVPAPAQGALAIECRRDAYEVASLLTDLHDIASYQVVAAERGLLAMLEGGCQLALGAHARLEEGVIALDAWYAGQRVRVSHASSEGAAMLAFEALGRPKGGV